MEQSPILQSQIEYFRTRAHLSLKLASNERPQTGVKIESRGRALSSSRSRSRSPTYSCKDSLAAACPGSQLRRRPLTTAFELNDALVAFPHFYNAAIGAL
jgi:hypothetical protein